MISQSFPLQAGGDDVNETFVGNVVLTEERRTAKEIVVKRSKKREGYCFILKPQDTLARGLVGRKQSLRRQGRVRELTNENCGVMDEAMKDEWRTW